MNKNAILRLSKYKNALQRFQALGLEKVFSDNLAEAVGVTPSQVRKDLSAFGLASGNKRGGYQIAALLDRMRESLGMGESYPVIVVGVGKIGAALLRYKGFARVNLRIVAAFDTDPAKQDAAASIPILPLENLAPFVRKHSVRLAVLAVPAAAAPSVLASLVAAGVPGILNFAPIELLGSDAVLVSNVHLESELESLLYFVRRREAGLHET